MDCTAEDEAEGAGGGEEAGAEAGAPEVRAGAHRLTTDAVWSCDGPPAACSRPAHGLPAAYPQPALGPYPQPTLGLPHRAPGPCRSQPTLGLRSAHRQPQLTLS